MHRYMAIVLHKCLSTSKRLLAIDALHSWHKIMSLLLRVSIALQKGRQLLWPFLWAQLQNLARNLMARTKGIVGVLGGGLPSPGA